MFQGLLRGIIRSVSFDPDAPAAPESGLYGLPEHEDPRICVIPVPFDATTSYRRGAADGPRAVLAASHQVDLFDPIFGRVYERGIRMLPEDPRILGWNAEARPLAAAVIERGGVLESDAELERGLARVNAIGAELNVLVRETAAGCLAEGRLPIVLGGDHAAPFGAIAACAEHYPSLGVLHFDAHADLRVSYEGFEWSHASIFHNVLTHTSVTRLVQVGLRDLGEREWARIETEGERVHALFDHTWAAARLVGGDMRELVRSALARLPEHVYVSFDVDGLDPALCPSTGTPVPGGLSWHEACLWLEELAASGRRVVGADLCEVSPGRTAAGEDSWDAIVGARLLYKLIGAALAARGPA